MKKQLKTLAIVLTLVITSLTQVSANEGLISKLEVKSNTEVVNTLNKKGKKIVKKNAKDLELYLSVMDLYNNAPASFYNLDEKTQKSFFTAVGQLNESLSSARNKEVKNLVSQVELNSAISNFIWSVKKSNSVILPVVDTTKVNYQTSL